MSCNSFGSLIPTRIEPALFFTRPVSLPSTRIGCWKPLKASLSMDVNASSPSFYDLLGITETGTMLEIKQAYKQLARKYHPDVSPPGRVQEYTQRFIRLQEAYETLSDPKRRELYDQDMAGGFHLAFSARRRSQKPDQQTVEKSEWKGRWQSQLSGLKNRSMYRDSGDNMSFGARMRQDREE